MQRRAERWNGEVDGLMVGQEGGCTCMEERSRVLTRRRRRRKKNTPHPRLFPRRPSEQQPLRPHLHLIPASLPPPLSLPLSRTHTRSLPLPRHVCRACDPPVCAATLMENGARIDPPPPCKYQRCAIVKQPCGLLPVRSLPPPDTAGIYQGVAAVRGNRRQREPERFVVTRVLSVSLSSLPVCLSVAWRQRRDFEAAVITVISDSFASF